MKIGIIVGSNRKLSNSLGLANWVKHHLNGIANEIEVFTPTTELLTTPTNFRAPMAVSSAEEYDDPVIQDYSRRISSCQGFVFISPVYNFSYSGQFKIMIDHLFKEFNGKPVVLIAQGPGSPDKALEEMKKVASKYSMDIVGENSLNIPKDYVMTPRRISHTYDPEATVDAFLKDHDSNLLANLKKLNPTQSLKDDFEKTSLEDK